MTQEIKHYPVMCREVLNLLDLKNKKIIVDCTVGIGSHAHKFLEVMDPDAFFIGIDRDEESLNIARKKLAQFKGKFSLIQGDFSQIDALLKNSRLKEKSSFPDNIFGVDIFFFDLGISTYQLNRPERGFSFLKEGPLDMRMDRNYFLSAYDLVNNLSEEELINIFRKYGEERYARRIARFIIEARKISPISTTTQLTRVILRAAPVRSRRFRIHPATRIFQALRIAVNRELGVLEKALSRSISLLNKGGRIGVISFHSLEDRIVKHTFKSFASSGTLKILTKKPLTPTESEKEENIASRSAKLRVAEKIC
ncbi:MAG: 16S rRNA (cytosine(1402)-N(4))-methyltransferase RsmH [Candidatus Omnitrophota bacterium]|nr:MAG: 16S rRNA (cytosine(1402)-N(4))-methyltransferase RsmH [Candidatus Omnitrophota bacterium]